MDIEAWADSYIRVQEARAMNDESHPDFLAAYEFMDELVGERAEQCWKGILAVIERNPSEYVIGMLAAGLIEDLIYNSGKEFIDRIEIQARKNPKFKNALKGVWSMGATESEIWKRVLIARGDIKSNA